MKAMIVPVTAFGQNCTILWCQKTQEAVVVDPGGDIEHIVASVNAKRLKVVKILLTHGHIDHAGAAGALKADLGVDVVGPHEDDAFLLDKLPDMAQNYGFPACESLKPDQWLKDGDTVSFGEEVLKVIHCPGHSPGSVVYFSETEKVAFVGDVLFKGSVGRTDLPGGNSKDLVKSIRNKLWPLGDDVVFIPGHGPTSTLGEERETNPFVGDSRM